MGKRILNMNNCTFVCPSLQGMISKNQMNCNFNDGTGSALTTNTTLTGNGICSILTAAANGTPTSCTLKMASNWISGIEMKKKINGISLLNEDAKMPCPIGSVICIQKPMPPVIPMISSNLGNLISGDFVNQIDKDNTLAKSDTDKDNNLSETDANKNDYTCTNQDDTDSQKENKEEISEEYSLCSYSSCEKAETCPYMNALSTISTNGAAAKLRENSREKEAEYDEYSFRKMEENNVSWNNQAHHMISINAAYCKYPELVKLGNYFEYDINCKENCCFLPCWESGDGYGKKSLHYKKAQAYEVMKVSGLQWHVGQHSYRIDIPDSVKEKYRELRTMDCYNDRINKDVKSFLSECYQRFDGICPENNYEVHKSWFIERMNALSEKIEKYLNLFIKNPKDSFPYFVSLESLRFAYEVPRSGKVILIYKTQTKWYFKRYKFVNNLKDPDIQVELLGSKELAIAEKHSNDTIKNMIIFCENVACFLIADETQSFKLPFQYNVHCQYIADSEKDKKEIHFSAMLAELADSGSDEYEAPKAVVVKRMKECGLR